MASGARSSSSGSITKASISALVSEFESTLSGDSGRRGSSLPSPTQFYHLGHVLANDGNGNDIPISNTLAQQVEQVIGSIPEWHFDYIMNTLNEAFDNTLQPKKKSANGDDDDENNNVLLALRSMYGLSSFFCLDTNNKSILLRLQQQQKQKTNSTILERMKLIASYGEISQEQQQKQRYILSLLGCNLLLLGNDFEQLLPAIHYLQNQNQLWIDVVNYFQKHNSQEQSWKDYIINQFPPNSMEYEYLVSMFSVIKQEEQEQEDLQNQIKQQLTVTTKTVPVVSKPTSSMEEIQRRVTQISQVLPDLGDGYIESALSHYNGDVERTLSALVEAQAMPQSLPPTLQLLDKKLPARWKKGGSKQKQDEQEKEAKEVAKRMVQSMEKQQEAEAFALEKIMSQPSAHHNLYDDDYDDQYDSIDGGGRIGADSGLYDLDYDNVKTYNRMMKQVEEENEFWEGNRNQNRSVNNKNNKKKKNKKNDDNEDENDNENDNNNSNTNQKKYRGPDKLKGGRIPTYNRNNNHDDNDNNENETGGGGGKRRGGGRVGRGGGGGRGRGGGGSGGGGRGRGNNNNKNKNNNNASQDNNNNNNQSSDPNNNNKPKNHNNRSKQRKMDKRRQQQKKAAANRTG